MSTGLIRGLAGVETCGFDGGMTETVLDGMLDLLLGGACVGCGRPGRLLCRACAAELPVQAAPAWPTPVPDGLVEPWAASAYAGTPRSMILGLKEQHYIQAAVGIDGLVVEYREDNGDHYACVDPLTVQRTIDLFKAFFEDPASIHEKGRWHKVDL